MSFSMKQGPGPGRKRPWRQGFTVLYMVGKGGNIVRPCRHSGLIGNQFRPDGVRLRGLRRPAAKLPRLPGDTPVPKDRSNGEDMDALIKSIRPSKSTDAAPET